MHEIPTGETLIEIIFVDTKTIKQILLFIIRNDHRSSENGQISKKAAYGIRNNFVE